MLGHFWEYQFFMEYRTYVHPISKNFYVRTGKEEKYEKNSESLPLQVWSFYMLHSHSNFSEKLRDQYSARQQVKFRDLTA